MPELPEVETVRRGLTPALLGHRLIAVTAHRPDLRFALPINFADRLAGRRVESIGRRAKYLLIGIEGQLTLIAHLGMSGRFQVSPQAGPRALHDHVVFVTDVGWSVSFNDPRRFGFMDLVATQDLETYPMLAALGPEPLGDAFTPAYLGSRLASRATPLKAALMDQRTVAGMGNIYASESLFRARLSPRRTAGSVAGTRARRLVAAIREVFAEAIEAGGSSLRNHHRPSGELGCFQHAFAVYDREGARCPGCVCDTVKTGGIRREVIAGRATFHCPRRQR